MKRFGIMLAALAIYVLAAILTQWPKGEKPQDETAGAAGTVIAEHYTAGEWRQADAEGGETDTSNVIDEEKRIALTFDDGPHPEYTVRLLEGLKEREVRATFFLVGSRVEQYPEIVQQMAADGHLIGSHTYSHAQLTSLSLRDACDELMAANDAIYKACGNIVTYVRPPYGLWSEVLNCAVELTEVGWSIDPEDWKVLNTDTVVKHVISHAEDGGIILLHDIYDTSVEAALQIIDRLQAKGWEFMTVDELLLY